MDASPIRGHLDGLQGTYVVGWALSPHQANCEITVLDDARKLVAEGLASIERADLRGLSSGGCNFAFRVPLPELNGATLLHVLADGVELPNSPIHVGPGRYDGYFAQHRGSIEGWVTERVTRFDPPDITIEDQHGRTVLRCPSIAEPAADGTFSPAKFAGDLDQSCFGAGELRLSARANGVKFAEINCAPLLMRGTLETATPTRVAGWLLSPSALARQFAIDIFRNGEHVLTTECDIERIDVQTAFPGSGTTGFDVALPEIPDAGLDFTTLSFRLPGSQAELFEGPYVLGNRPALVLAARKISRLALGSLSGLLSPGERSVMQTALSDFLSKARHTDRMLLTRQASPTPADHGGGPQLNIIIPIYRGVAITRACIDSVIATHAPKQHRIILVNDRSPDPDMAPMLRRYAGRPNVFLLTNETNLGFVKSVNRGLGFCREGDVLLLNSDTRLFRGGLGELCKVAHQCDDIGTVTALSNNATIFSYPHPTLRGEQLDDIEWEELAAAALAKNSGIAVDVPTGHGFCLLIKREVLRRIGNLDEVFGRGYGEENDLCARAADLGYRNVAATAVVVEHRESVSFTGDKAELLTTNLRTLEGRYPEYTPIIMDVERRDVLRAARWPLDALRLKRARDAGTRFALIIRNNLGGGTSQAIADIEETVGYGDAKLLTLSCRADGFMELTAPSPAMHAQFAPDEAVELVALLASATIDLVVVHQVLGFSALFLKHFAAWVGGRHGVYYAHDFYPICPRVTMIDAVEHFCGLAPVEVCTRCLKLGGPHNSSRLTELSPGEHRDLFALFLAAFKHVVAPSGNAASYIRTIFPALSVEVIPHPGPPVDFPAQPRKASSDEVVLFGAIGSHKGSAKLLEIVQLARLTHPQMRFRVIGFTNRDDELRKSGNVTVTGPYSPPQLAGLVQRATGRIALFLSGWPETYSYTLSESVKLGFIPLVPDIGAPAERVRATGFGRVFPFPIMAAEVLRIIVEASAEVTTAADPGPTAFRSPDTSVELTRRVFALE